MNACTNLESKNIYKFKYSPFLFLSLTVHLLATLATLLVTKLSKHYSYLMAFAFARTCPRSSTPTCPQGLLPHFSPSLSPTVVSLEQCSLTIWKPYPNHTPFPASHVFQSTHHYLTLLCLQWIIWSSLCPRINYFSLHKTLNFMSIFFSMSLFFGSLTSRKIPGA